MFRQGVVGVPMTYILHMADEILNFGVPLELDTDDNKSHHIPAKVAAQLTQKIKKNVEESTSKRLIEKKVLDLACMEIRECCCGSTVRVTKLWMNQRLLPLTRLTLSRQKGKFALAGRPFGPERAC